MNDLHLTIEEALEVKTWQVGRMGGGSQAFSTGMTKLLTKPKLQDFPSSEGITVFDLRNNKQYLNSTKSGKIRWDNTELYQSVQEIII